MKKRLLSIILCVSMLSGMLIGCSAGKNAAVFDKEELPMYYLSADNKRTVTLYFADEGHEIPYLDTDTVKGLLEDIFHDVNFDSDYALNVSKDSHTATFTRENGYTMELNCDNDEIRFVDYDAFLMPSYSPTVIDVLEHYGLIPWLKQVEESSYSRYGSEVCFDLSQYGIDIIEHGGDCFIPMQTLSDLLTSLTCYVNFYYDGRAVYLNEYGSANEAGLFEKYYMTKGDKTRSEKLAGFTYNELCMTLDYCYGLKERHGIISFDDFFNETGLKERLLSEDAEESARAMNELENLYFADGHSAYIGNSWRLGEDTDTSSGLGKSLSDFDSHVEEFETAAEEIYPDGIPGYEEVGNTAYITFTSFDTIPSDADYYNNPPAKDCKDTVGICLYAFSQITRAGSPVENVVLDLSRNGGGDTTTASFVLSMFLGEASVCVEDTLTGAYMNEAFCCDANLDGEFDEKDSLLNYRLFCLTSPFSFSCGNLVPSVLKDSEKVKTIGMTTGGGACIVMPISTADGTRLQISGNRRLGYMKNGAVYDIDEGVEPDYPISTAGHFYDRSALTEYINGIY